MTKQDLEQLIEQMIEENTYATSNYMGRYVENADRAACAIVEKLIAEFNIPLTQG